MSGNFTQKSELQKLLDAFKDAYLSYVKNNQIQNWKKLSQIGARLF